MLSIEIHMEFPSKKLLRKGKNVSLQLKKWRVIKTYFSNLIFLFVAAVVPVQFEKTQIETIKWHILKDLHRFKCVIIIVYHYLRQWLSTRNAVLSIHDMNFFALSEDVSTHNSFWMILLNQMVIFIDKSSRFGAFSRNEKKTNFQTQILGQNGDKINE